MWLAGREKKEDGRTDGRTMKSGAVGEYLSAAPGEVSRGKVRRGALRLREVRRTDEGVTRGVLRLWRISQQKMKTPSEQKGK